MKQNEICRLFLAVFILKSTCVTKTGSTASNYFQPLRAGPSTHGTLALREAVTFRFAVDAATVKWISIVQPRTVTGPILA